MGKTDGSRGGEPGDTELGGGSLWNEAEGEKAEKNEEGSLWSTDDSASEGPWDFGISLWNKFSYGTEKENDFESDHSNHFRARAHLEYRQSDRFYAKAAVQGDYFLYSYDSGNEDDADIRVS